MAWVAVLATVLLATSSLTARPALGATGGLPGTGTRGFNPAGDAEDNHCFSPNGADVNELLGISEFLFVPGACDVMEAGDFYVPIFGPGSWTMGPAWLEVPSDFTPSAPTPLEDFLGKVQSMTFIVDQGTALEHSYRYAAPDVVDVRSIRDFFEQVPDIPLALFLAKLPPLPPGDHRVAYQIEMSSRHCDGLGSSASNCLQAGMTRLGSCPFTVVPRQPQAMRP